MLQSRFTGFAGEESIKDTPESKDGPKSRRPCELCVCYSDDRAWEDFRVGSTWRVWKRPAREAHCGLMKTTVVDGEHAKGWTAVAPTWCWESSSSGQHIFPLAHTEPMHRWWEKPVSSEAGADIQGNREEVPVSECVLKTEAALKDVGAGGTQKWLCS